MIDRIKSLVKKLSMQDDDTIYAKVDFAGKTKLVEIKIVNNEVVMALYTGIYITTLTDELNKLLIFTNTTLFEAEMPIVAMIIDSELMFVVMAESEPTNIEITEAFLNLSIAPAPFMFGFEALAAGERLLDDSYYDIEYLIKKTNDMTDSKSSNAIYTFGYTTNNEC